MSWFRVGGLGIVLLGAAVVASGQSEEKTPCCGGQTGKARAEEPTKFPPPCACPLWVIEPVATEFLYYAEFFPESCGDDPIAIELQGNYALSEGCAEEPNNCEDFSKRRAKLASARYPGRAEYIKSDELLHLPADTDGKGDICAKLFDVSYISFQPDPTAEENRYAKVFGFELDRKTRYGKEHLSNPKIYVGVEMEGAPQGDLAPFASTERLEPTDINEKCFVYRAVVRGNGKPRQILLLTKGEAEAKK